MGIFSRNFDRPGPGVSKDAPKKKGFARFFEIMGRDFFDLWKVNLLTALFFLPMLAVAGFAWVYRQYAGMLLLSALAFLIASLPVGPALCALQSIVSRMVRDDPFFFWHEYKKAWKSCWKQAMPLGAVLCLLGGAECLALGMYFTMGTQNFFVLFALLLGLLLQAAVWLLATLQMVYMDLGTLSLLKNSLLIFFGRVKRTLPAVLTVVVVMGALFLFLNPALLPLLVLLGVPTWLLVSADMWLWPALDELFNLDQRLADKRAAEDAQPPEGA